MSDLPPRWMKALVERLQRGAFSYLLEYSNPENGLVADTSRAGLAVQHRRDGLRAFLLSGRRQERLALPRRGRRPHARGAALLRAQPAERSQPDATGYKGFYYHFLDMKTGRRVWQCELSLVDTALLMAGVLTVASYFDGGGDESEIHALADALYRRVDWRWAQYGTETVSQGWKPECGFLHYGWEGYNEATVLYVLGLGSPTFPLTESG